MVDYHIHTHHSIDAHGSVREYCERAHSLGLEEICFTNHCELDPTRNDNLIRFDTNPEPITRDRIQVLRNEILGVQQEFATRGLVVKFGIEIGYFPGINARLREVTDGIPFDFVLGSIHCLEHICIDSSREYQTYFKQYDVPALLDRYYDAIVALIKSRYYDAVAHLDVYKKYGIGHYGNVIKDIPVDHLKTVFRAMKEHDIALEINTAGLRRVDEIYPSPGIMRYARTQGIEMITIGSDAHQTDDLGKGLNQGIAYAKSFGFEHLCVYHERRVQRLKL